MQRKHEKQMEHLRFLVHNRLNAKADPLPQQPLDSSVSVDDDVGVAAQLPTAAASASAAHADPTAGDEASAASAASAAAADGAYDPSEDLQHQADWKESIKPIGYLRSCFRRKVSRECLQASARSLSSFHNSSPHHPRTPRPGSRTWCRARWHR
jgi:hypothetical protein